MNFMEKILNIFVGMILLNNFYYLGFFVGIEYSQVLTFSASIAGLFFLKACFFSRYATLYFLYQSALTTIVGSIVFLSILAWALLPHEQTDLDFNDLLRIIIIFLYFGWTALKYGSSSEFESHLLNIVTFSIIITIPLAFFESQFPGVFGIMFKEGKQFDETTWWRRVGGTIRDPNAYSCLIVLYGYFLYELSFKQKEKKYFWIVLLLIFALYLVNLSGSRQGFILFFILAFYIFQDSELSKNEQLIVFSTSLVLSVLYIFYSFISQSELDSVIDRVFKDNANAENSSSDRIQSLINGINFSVSQYYTLYGPGSILFNAFWTKKFPDQYADVAAHNVFVYHLSQFGIWCASIYYGIWLVIKKAYQNNKKVLAFIFLVIISFLSNILYYGIGLIIVWYLDVICYRDKIKQID